MSKRVLVTGASGFVGSVLARKLIAEGHETHLIIRPGSNAWRLEGVDASRHEIDIADGEQLAPTVRSIRADWIFHLAAHGAYPSQTDRRRMVEANVVGTMNLVDAARDVGFEAFVNAGSSSEYGFRDHPPAENEREEPNSNYAVTKLSQTTFCRFAAREHKIHLPTLRLYSVYGPYEEPTRLVPTVIVRGLEGTFPPLVSPDVARDFVYIDDVVDAFVVAAEQNASEHGGIYNIGTGNQTLIRDVVDLARTSFDIEHEPEWETMASRTWDTRSWVSNPQKAERELGWRATTSFEEGFRRFTEWVRSGHERYR